MRKASQSAAEFGERGGLNCGEAVAMLMKRHSSRQGIAPMYVSQLSIAYFLKFDFLVVKYLQE